MGDVAGYGDAASQRRVMGMAKRQRQRDTGPGRSYVSADLPERPVRQSRKGGLGAPILAAWDSLRQIGQYDHKRTR